MAKLPSQNKMNYRTGSLVNDSIAGITSGGVSGGLLNVPRDLSFLNFRGYASTTRKGVPLIYRCRVSFNMTDFDGTGPSSEADNTAGNRLIGDAQATLKIDGAQDNWVMRNAAVKWHAAREKMFRDAGVLKKDRGSYSHEIRYNYSGNDDSFIKPVDGSGNAFNGGTWDLTTLSQPSDSDFQLKLTGVGDDEEADAFSGDSLQIGHSYLLSRVNQQADTNLQAEEGPAKYSMLGKLLADNEGSQRGTTDNVIATGRSEQDNPPYEVLDISDSGDVNHDITEQVELGRCVVGYGHPTSSTIVDIPFGIANLRARFHDAADTVATTTG